MQDIALIRDKHGAFAVVDGDLFYELNRFIWYHTGGGYFARRTRDKESRLVYLHAQINGTPPGKHNHTDHINRVIYDCTRKNLRTATRSQNMLLNRNQRKTAFHSRYKGVCRVLSKTKVIRPWRAMIRSNGKQFHLGVFLTEKEAALAYNAAAKLHFGEFAKVNEV